MGEHSLKLSPDVIEGLSKGHLICHACRPRVVRCPVCRFVFQGGAHIRNRFIEKLSEKYFSATEKSADTE